MSSSAKFKLEVKALEPSVANFSSGTKDANIIITPDYYSNVEYAIFGSRSGNENHAAEAYIAVGSNGYDTIVATFSECNISFYNDTIVRGNLVVDGYITALELDVVLSQQEIFAGTNHHGFVDAGSNVLAFKYLELTDTSILHTSNTITNTLQSSFSNLYRAGKNVLEGNSDFMEAFDSQQNIYNPDKFDERFSTITADYIGNGTTNRYIYNDKFNNNLVVKGDFVADDISTNSIYVENEVSATRIYGDGSLLTNIIAGDGTTDSILEGTKLYYKPEYVGEIAAASNIHASNYASSVYSPDLQASIDGKFKDTSNFAINASNMLTDTLYNEIVNVSNYIINNFTSVEDASMQSSADNHAYIDANIMSSSNYMLNVNEVYVATDALSNLLIETINPAIANVSNYILLTSNILYTALNQTDMSVLADITSILHSITNLQDNKWTNVSNTILGEDGYSNLFDTRMKSEYGLHLDTYIVSSSNQAVYDIDTNNADTISHIDSIRDDIIDKLATDITQHTADIATIMSDLHAYIDTKSLASSNAVDTVRDDILNYLSARIQSHIQHLGETSNLFHSTSNVTHTGIKDALKHTLDYERNSSNELMHTLEANIARLLGNASFVLNKTNADINTKITTLNTDKIPEGTSNIYYTEAEFDRLFAKLTFDNFKQGADNKFIVNNVYNNNLRVLGTIFASNMVIDGELSTILTNVYQSGSAKISSSNDVPLSVTQLSTDDNSYIFGLSNALNAPIFTVSSSGSVAIGKTNAAYDIDASGIFRAPLLKGLASSITDVNLDSKSTDFLAQGANLYFNGSRVSYLIDASNLDVSNYVMITSNNLLAAFPLIDIQSNYIDQQSNIVYAYSSNININTFNYLSLIVANISNLVAVSSNNHSNYVSFTSNSLSIYTSNSLVNVSNYVTTSSNALLGRIKLNEYMQSNYSIKVNSDISFAKAELDGSNYVSRTSNLLYTYMNNAKFDINQSNYASRTCNILFNAIRTSNFHLSNYLSLASNNILRHLGTSNVSMSNYILRTSNEMMSYFLNNLGAISATANAYSITDVYSGDKIMHFNFNDLKIINNADDTNFQLLNRTAITPVYPNITTANPTISAVNNFFTQYEPTNRYALASSNNIYVFNNDDTDAKTILNMMNTSGFVIHFVFRAQFVQNTPIFYVGNSKLSMLNIKLLYGNLHITIGSPYNFITIIVLTPIVPLVWYVVDIAASIASGNIIFRVHLNSILQTFVLRTNTISTITPLLLQSVAYNNILQYNGTIGYSIIDGNISTSIAPILISGNDYCFFYTGNNVSYTVLVQANTVCDILMIGGGGSGGDLHGGGGGAGGMVFMKSVTLPVGTYTFTIGGGGVGGQKGFNTKITLNGTDILVAEGGGAGSGGNPGGNGGSGGGGDGWGGPQQAGVANNPGSSVFTYNGVTGVKYGNNGGNATSDSPGGGGGGAGTAGNFASATTNASFGGDGRNDAVVGGTTYDFVNVFGSPILNYGVNNDNNNTRYFAGGGTGGRVNYTSKGGGGRGGGGDNVNISAGIANTGSGGGGGGANGSSQPGAAGGSGILILRASISQIPVTKNISIDPLQTLLGCSNLTDTYEENFAYRQGVAYTNTYFSSNPWTIPAPAPILRSSAHNYNSYSNLIFSSYFASNFDYQYSSNISTLNSAIVANPANATFYQNFHDNADATRLTIGDRNIANLNFVFTEVETNIRLQTGYYYFMLDLQNEVTADLLLGEQSDTSIDNYLNVANYYNSNLLNSPAATIAHTSNQVLTYPLYIPEGYYRFYLRMLRTITNRHIKYFIPQYYYTNTWTSPSYSLNNSNAFTYISYNTLNSTYQTGRTLNINDRFVVNNNATGATSNLYVYRYFNQGTFACGYNAYGQLGVHATSTANRFIPTQVLNISGITQVSAGELHSLFLKSDGAVFACGTNISGRLGVTSVTTDTAVRFIPTQVLNYSGGTGTYISGITQIAGGSSHSLFLRSDGAVFACGWNTSGQLGVHVSDTADRFIPTQVLNYSGGTGTYISGITQIAGGGSHSLFLKSDGAVFACGYNDYGQLGVHATSTAARFIPTQVLNYSGGTGTYISGITQIAGGGSHSLFRRSDGAVFACGWNYYGQLGVHATSTANRFIPTQVLNMSGITQIAAGQNHSLFLKSDGTVFACGYNDYGQLGVHVSDTANRFIPTQVLNYSGGTGTYISGITQIAAGGYHSLFLRGSDGAVFACGWNYYGQLGVHASDTANRFIPTQVLNMSGITQISVGTYHSLFIAKIPVLVNVSNYNYNISHSNIITPNTFFAANRYSSSNLLNIQDFKIFNNPTVMGSDFSINNILYAGKDSSNLVALNKIRFNKWQETSDYATLTNKYVYYTEGNVGIGNTVPTTASLDINTSVLTAYDNSTIYSMKTNRPVWTNLGLITSSDERIKKNIKDIDDNTALHQILKVEPKSYNYMDKNNTTSNIYGFIAQQIKTVIPQAVSMHTEAVPNIYTIGSIIANKVTVRLNNALSGIKKVLLIDILGNRYVEAVWSSQQTEGTLQIEIENTNKIPDGSIFVYGTIVDDFHALDKSYIYTLNVCALQDIYKSYANLKDQLTLCTANYSNILPLQDTLTSTLSEYNSAITSSYSSLTTTQKELQNQVDFLKHANNTLMQNIETYKQSQSSNCIELEHLQAENNILTSANNEITKEHESLIKQISEQSQEIFTIKSILQLNNIV
jgi:alpha-tubulin suppressor-like RCC1 family protein